jgi:hypothetical protein
MPLDFYSCNNQTMHTGMKSVHGIIRIFDDGYFVRIFNTDGSALGAALPANINS